MRALLLAAAILAVCATSASAIAPLGRTVLTGGDPAHRAQYQAWIDASLAPQVKVTVKLIEKPCPESPEGAPCVDFQTGRWKLYIDAGWLEPQNLRSGWLNTLHEIGHIYDFEHPRDRHRTRFLRVFGYEGWLDPLNTTWEKFAMAYGYCAAGLSWAEYRLELPADGAFASRNSTEEGGWWGYGYDVGRRDYREACRVIGRRR